MIGSNNAVYIAEDTDSFDNIYQYDPLGMTAGLGFENETGWFANVFKMGGKDENLNGVGFFARGDNSSYEIFVCTDYKTEEDLKECTSIAKGTLEFAGYHTIKFEKPEKIEAGNKFAVVVKITIPGAEYPIPLEKPQEGYTSNATAEKGQSFFSSNGEYWEDVNIEYPNTNVTLKALQKYWNR